MTRQHVTVALSGDGGDEDDMDLSLAPASEPLDRLKKELSSTRKLVEQLDTLSKE